MSPSNFIIGQQTNEYIYIIDISKDLKSVTNSVDEVLLFLFKNCQLGDRRLIYRDSMGQIDEIKHENGLFKGFAPGHSGIGSLPDFNSTLARNLFSFHIQ